MPLLLRKSADERDTPAAVTELDESTDQFQIDTETCPIESQEPAESVDAGLREHVETQQHQHPPQDYQIGRDRPRRTNVKAPSRFSDYEMMFYVLLSKSSLQSQVLIHKP